MCAITPVVRQAAVIRVAMPVTCTTGNSTVAEVHRDTDPSGAHERWAPNAVEVLLAVVLPTCNVVVSQRPWAAGSGAR